MKRKIENLAQALEASAKIYPTECALIFGKKKMTYGQLNGQADRICSGLMALGIGKGQRVGILLQNRPEFVISYFSILKADATVVPINNMLKLEEVKYILRDSDASALITSPGFMEMANQLRQEIEGLKHIILVGASAEFEAISFQKMLQESPKPGNRLLEFDREREAVIMYTSGTTGHPKGAMLTHHNLLSNAAACVKAIKVSRWDNLICVLPMFHSFAATVCVLAPLLVGAKVTILASPRPFKRILRTIRKRRVTIFAGIPSMFNILKDARVPKLRTMPIVRLLNPLRLCISGAAALSVETLKGFERRFKVPLIEGYGLTEASPVVCLNPMRGIRKPGSIGLPLPGVEVKVVSEDGKELGPGDAGELLVRGANVMKGYLNQPEANAETLKDNWLYTGDIAKKDVDGYIYIVGRKKEMINVRGLNVYPREVEEVLCQHPQVKEAAIIGVSDPNKGEVPKGFVVLKEPGAVTSGELIYFLKERIASYKVPRHIELRESLPKTTTGKILKRALKELVASDEIGLASGFERYAKII